MGSRGYLYAAKLRPRAGVSGCILEIGSSRKDANEGSTEALAEAAGWLGIPFYSVDTDEQAYAHTRTLPGVLALYGRGEDVLAAWAGRPAPLFTWLDGYDWPYSFYCPPAKVAEYAKRGEALTETASQDSHLQITKLLQGLTGPGAVAAFDDTWQRPDGIWRGKGGAAVPFLLETGWWIIEQTPQAVEPDDGYVILERLG